MSRLRGFGHRAIGEAGLGLSLSFVAGAVNAGGFLLVGHYTSHMSGILSAMADAAVLNVAGTVLLGGSAVLAFLLGAALSAVLIHWGRRHPHRPPHALPLELEALLLLVLGILGGPVRSELVTWLAMPLLCFIMGLQNATMSKISASRIRTTHMTGVVTDLGIEIGKRLYWNRAARPAAPAVRADRPKMALLAGLLLAFVLGGVLGALAFLRLGFVSTIPLAAALLLLSHAIVRSGRKVAIRRQGRPGP